MSDDSTTPAETEPTTGTVAPEPTPAPEPLPHWVEEVVAEIQRLGNVVLSISGDISRLWDNAFEHHNRMSALIADLRKHGVPFEALADHYTEHKAELPEATPHGVATEPEAIPGVPQA